VYLGVSKTIKKSCFDFNGKIEMSCNNWCSYET